jgi:hypothetical protein
MGKSALPRIIPQRYTIFNAVSTVMFCIAIRTITH